MNIARFLIIFLIAFLVIGAAFTLLGWFFQFSGLFFVEDLFANANPLGIIGTVAILLVGGFYLFNIGFTVLRNSL